MDDFHRITAIRPDQDDYFVYSYALGGRQEAMLVSDVVNCQLGGATIKYWYWKTGKDVALDVCIRQPPGNRDRAALKCYDGLSTTFAQQWQFRAIELPPVSQPFELIFRALFTAPLDIIALDNIQYNAILCEGESRPSSSSSSFRSRRSPSALQVMGLNEWRALGIQVEADAHTPVMLIVGDNVPEASETTTVTSTTTISLFTFPTLKPLTFPTLTLLTTTEAPTTTTSADYPPETTSTEPTSKATTTSAPKEEVAASLDSAPAVDHMDNAVKFIKNIQPVLPYIPALVRSIQAIDPRVAAATGIDPLSELNELSKIVGIDLVETASEIRRASAHGAPIAPVGAEEERVAALVTDLSSSMDHRYGGVLRDRAPIGTAAAPAPPAPKANIFGLERASRAPSFTSPTVYPPRLVKSLKTNVQRQPSESTGGVVEETMDLSHLSTEEIKQLEQFHRKIFHRRGEPSPPAPSLPSADDWTPAPPLVVFKKNRVVEPAAAPPAIAPPMYNPPREEAPELTLGGANSMSEMLMEHMGDLKDVLPPDALEDLSKLREIPDLDELTKGMDVSLINKPGGFATLKKQFMQRMIRRSLGLPPTDDTPPRGMMGQRRKPLPAPIVPIKITRKAMMKAMRAMKSRA
ncbi:hypothetical protein PENTCL1PPCAC_28048 [Pristionchus entomophagus]|uniref:MAM domain-containing protein n=1 Tax=Pristionchus entomophagus TaxID=358040 RepID=A0AAV5UIX4_9BILA|nr:hypothetical protein PENTCL1PPCAC_28048 [Pristionchus entomophagus]